MNDNTGSDAVDLDALEALAKAATPGPWAHPRFGVLVAGPMRKYVNGEGREQIAMTTGASWMRKDEPLANADFIAAANPATVLALIAQARAAAPAATDAADDTLEELMHKHSLIGVAGDNPNWEARLIAYANDARRLPSTQQAGVEAVPVATAEHRAVIEEAAQVLESAAAHNRAKGRTVLERTQQDRANRLRAILAAPVAQQAAPLTEAPEGIRGPLTDEQRQECRYLYNNLKHLESGGYHTADDVIRKAAGYGYMNGFRDFGSEAGSAASVVDARDAERYRAWRDNMLAHNEAFLNAMQEFLPEDVGTDRDPTAAEWDDAIDKASIRAAMAASPAQPKEGRQ